MDELAEARTFVITLEFKEDFLVWRRGSGDTVEILDISVTSDRRRHGRGRRLVEQLFGQMPKRVKTIWAITRAENFIAQEFYTALGFHIMGLLRDFYGVKTEDGKSTIDAIMYGFPINRGGS